MAVLWVLICLGIGIYINGVGLREKQHYKIGFFTMGVSYLIGVVLLAVIIITH